MSDHVFTGPGAHSYPQSKDRAGRPVGQVEPGDVRDTDGPLDGHWVSARSKAGKAASEAAEQARADARKAGEEDTPAGDGQPSGETGQQASEQPGGEENTADAGSARNTSHTPAGTSN
ncbi:MAG TPA: hypothetical protein VGD68_18175, partial [Streptosporangiaceae bacterium]